MRCRGRCFTVVDGVQGSPVVHGEASRLGLTWYFCPAHHEFHAMFLLDGEPQPFCGECAVLFFDRAPGANWLRQYDLPAVMSNSAQVLDDAREDMDALLREIDNVRFARRRVGGDPFITPGNLDADVVREIPKHDLTYSSLGTTLIPHARIPNMFLLEYRTFQGALAYQPCSKDIGISGIFKSLCPIDQYGDPVFKQARTWCCMVQAMEGLPKELRWVLATMYNFCNEMLLPGTDEDTLWEMRTWLLHWYTITDRLLELFGIFAYTPDINWFHRPMSRSSYPAASRSESLEFPTIGPSDSNTSSRGGTVIRHRPNGENVRDRWPRAHYETRVSTIHGWLSSQPYLPDLDGTAIFDPTPGGYVSPRTRRSTPPDGQGLSRSRSSTRSWTSALGLNPRAVVFDPPWTAAPPPPPCPSQEHHAAQEGDDGDATVDDSATGTDSARCSSPALSDWSFGTSIDCEEELLGYEQ
ncbi:Uncharacterized protein TCAP_04979 [Tolypocladium capitatum]|uniref:Uncharacterized protein n=1 Tax=Tolypocladium capitatum TaxID=45235 RepID=A0A2K3QC28_9HYPO|nr:Uncharacterized protein TCAP_04979 [Tolypocladium capitatum]